MDDPALDILKMQYQALRDEFMEKLRSSYQLGQYKVLAIGAILGAAIAKDTNKSVYLEDLFVVAMLLPMAFDAALYFNGQGMIKIGRYMRDNLEPGLKRCVADLRGQMLWEEYIGTSCGNNGRLWWNLFELVQPLLTIALQLLILLRLSPEAALACAIGWIAVALEGVLVVQVLRQK